MEYRRLGNSGLKVSPLCLGTMLFGEYTSKEVASRIVGTAFDAGVNFIDTADIYVAGRSEVIVGELIGRQRDRWVLGTKVETQFFPRDPNSGGLGSKWILYEVDRSLTRLKTDYIDIYYLHRDDLETPLQETIGTMGQLIRCGKIRYFGLSNYQGWRISEAVHVCETLGVPQPIALQPYYNAMNRQAEVEMLPACGHYGLGVVPYSALARGVLTGKYVPGARPPRGTRAGRNDKRMFETEFRSESLKFAQRIKQHAEKRGMTAGQFAVNWLLNNNLVTSVLAGPRTLEQWQDYLGALEHEFDENDEKLIATMVAAGHPSTHGYTDPKFPVAGRILRDRRQS